jgi:hypothetical protein
MAKATNAASTSNVKPKERKGFTKVGHREVDGYLNNEAGSEAVGKLVGDFTIKKSKFGPKHIALIELTEPTSAVTTGGQVVSLVAGQVVGLTITPGLRDLVDFIDSLALVAVTCKGKRTLKNGNSLWDWEVSVADGSRKAPRSVGEPEEREESIPF